MTEPGNKSKKIYGKMNDHAINKPSKNLYNYRIIEQRQNSGAAEQLGERSKRQRTRHIEADELKERAKRHRRIIAG